MKIFGLPYNQLKYVIFITNIIFLLFLIILCLTFFYKSSILTQLLRGLLFGGIASLLNFKLLAQKTEAMMYAAEKGNENKKSGIGGMIKGYFIRYMIMGGVLAGAALRKDEFNMITTIIGLFSAQLTIYILYAVDFILELKNKNRGN